MNNPPPRNKIKKGQQVAIIQKQHQKTGKLTTGTVNRILTRSKTHPHGIKVKLTNNKIGRVQKILKN